MLVLFLLLAFLSNTLLFADPFSVRLVNVYPNQLEVDWKEVEGVDYYDVYLDGKALERTTDTSCLVGSNDDPLSSHTQYEIIVAGRAQGNIDRVAAKVSGTTSGWEGRYHWDNKTEKDNDGRCKQLDFLVTFTNGSYQVYGLFDVQHRLFPLVLEQDMNKEFSYEGDRSEQRAYRMSASLFNTTSITPKTWRVSKLELLPSTFLVEVKTKVGSLHFTTTSRYHFCLDVHKKPLLLFETQGTGMAAWGVFSSPNPGEDGVYVCSLVE